MTGLTQLAHRLRNTQSAIDFNEAVVEAMQLIEAAASEPLGTEWTERYPPGKAHNFDLAAARIVVAALRKELDEVESIKLNLVAEVAALRARCRRLRELAFASVRPQGLVTSPESVRWFNARHKCDAHNDLTQGGSDGQ